MEISGTIYHKVSIDPKLVIQNLIDSAIGDRNWIFKKDSKFFVGFEQSAGIHSFECEEEISQEKYEYVMALKLVLKELNKTNLNT